MINWVSLYKFIWKSQFQLETWINQDKPGQFIKVYLEIAIPTGNYDKLGQFIPIYLEIDLEIDLEIEPIYKAVINQL